MGVPGTINPVTGNVFGGTPTGGGGGGGSSNVQPSGRVTTSGEPIFEVAPTETDVRRLASEQRVQTFSGARKLSDTSRVEVTVGGQRKFVTPERALAMSQPGTIKFREAERKIESRGSLESKIRSRLERESEEKRIGGVEQITSVGQPPLRRPTVELEAIKTPVSDEAKARARKDIPTSRLLREGEIKEFESDILPFKEPPKKFFTPIDTPAETERQQKRLADQPIGLKIIDRELVFQTGIKEVRGGEVPKGVSLIDFGVVSEAILAQTIALPGTVITAAKTIELGIQTGAGTIATVTGTGAAGKAVTAIALKTIVAEGVGGVAKGVIQFEVPEDRPGLRGDLFAAVDIGKGLVISGGVVSETSSFLGTLPGISNLAQGGTFAKTIGATIKSFGATITGIEAVQLQQPSLERSLIGEEEREFLRTTGGREQALELIMEGRAGKRAEPSGGFFKGLLLGLAPSFKSDIGFISAAEERARELGFEQPGLVASAALGLEKVEEVKFTQRIIIPEIGANLLGGDLDVIFPNGRAIPTRLIPGVLEASTASVVALERSPLTEIEILGQTITFEQSPFFIKLPDKGAKEKLRLSQQTFESRLGGFETSIAGFERVGGVAQIPESLIGDIQRRKTDLESSRKEFEQAQKTFQESGKLRFGSFAIVPTAGVIGGVSAAAFKGFESFVQRKLPKTGPKISQAVGFGIDFPEEILGDIVTPSESSFLARKPLPIEVEKNWPEDVMEL